MDDASEGQVIATSDRAGCGPFPHQRLRSPGTRRRNSNGGTAACMRACVCLRACVCMYVHVCVCICVCMCECMHTCAHSCVPACLCVHACVHVCMCVHCVHM